MKNLILLAVQGAGKGTVARLLSEKYGYVSISMGDVLRAACCDGTKRAEIIKSYLDKGSLVPLDITLELLKDRISQPDCENGYILDGFPRNLEQAEELEKIMDDNKIVINLNIPSDEIKKRILGRRTCSGCGKIYNINYENMKPKQDGICDNCNQKLFTRTDDTLEVLSNRIDIYNKETIPVLEYYSKKQRLSIIKSIDLDEIMKCIDEIINSIGE